MANEVKLKLSMEGGKVVAAEIDGVTASLSQTGNAARKAATDLQPTTQSVDKLGVSAKQTAAALRGVPAQFTDIITSLQGGQAPLTVFMQQGGQLKDMFGGAGNAAQALGGYVLGLINPFTIAAAAAGGLAYAWYVGAAEGQAYTRSIILSGNAAGVTSREMAAMAQNIGATTQATVGAAAEAVAAFVGSGNIAGEQIARFSSLAVAMERETGQSVKKTAELFEDLGKKPVEASVKLNETTHYLTLSVYEQIKALEQQGRVSEAGTLAQTAMADAMESRMPKLVENLGYFETAWRRVWDAVKGTGDAILAIGRQADPVAELQKAIAVREGYVRDNRTGALPTDDAKLNALRQELTYLGETERMTRRVAAEQADANKTVQEKIEFDKRGNAFLSDKVKLQNALNKEIESGRELLASGAITAKQYADRLNDVQASFAKKGAAAPLSEAAKGLALYNDLLDIGSGYTATYAEDQRKLAAAFKSGLIPSYAQYTAAVEILMARQPGMVAREKEHAKVIAESARSYESSAKAALKYNADLANNNEALEKSNAKLAEENALMGLSEESKARLTLARMDAAIATAQEAFALLNLQNSSEIEIATAQRRIDLMKEQRALSGQGIMVKEAMATAAEWKKTADSIRDSLTDAFMSAIDGTKSLWVALRDSVVGMFKNMVLRPIVQGVIGAGVSAVAGSAAAGALGFGGSAAGAAAGASMSGGVTSLLGSSSMGALDIMGFDPTTLAIGAAILVLSQMGGKFVSAADSGRARVDYSSAGIGGAAYNTTGDASQIKGANKRVESLAESYFTTAAALGISALRATFEVGSNTGKEGAAPMTVLGVNIGKTGYSSGEVSSGDAVALQLAASRALMTALQASELPEYLRGAFDGLTASAMTQDEINQTLTSAQSVKAFHEAVQALPFESVKNLSYQATINLANASGGLDTLQASLTNMATASAAAKEGIKGLVAGISASVDKTLWDMQYGMADNKGKYGMLDVRGATLDQQMRSATDINEIAKYGNAEIANITQAWGLLSAEQQAASFAQYETILNGIEEYISGKGADALALQTAKDEKSAATIATAVEAAVAKAMASSAAAMQAAADKADKPVVVNSRIEVDVSAPAGFEVRTSGGSR